MQINAIGNRVSFGIVNLHGQRYNMNNNTFDKEESMSIDHTKIKDIYETEHGAAMFEIEENGKSVAVLTKIPVDLVLSVADKIKGGATVTFAPELPPDTVIYTRERNPVS